MKKLIFLIIVLFVFTSTISAQNFANDKVVVAYIILYANSQADLQKQVQNYLNFSAL